MPTSTSWVTRQEEEIWPRTSGVNLWEQPQNSGERAGELEALLRGRFPVHSLHACAFQQSDDENECYKGHDGDVQVGRVDVGAGRRVCVLGGETNEKKRLVNDAAGPRRQWEPRGTAPNAVKSSVIVPVASGERQRGP